MPAEPLSTSGATPDLMHVPCDLYGLFAAEPLQLDVRVDGCMIVLLVMVRAFFFIVLNFLIQILYVVRIHRLSWDLKGEQCKHSHSYMQVVCVFVFSVSIFRELRNCMDFLALLVRCPVSQASGYMGIGHGSDSSHRHGAVLHEERKDPVGFMLNWARRRTSSSQTHTWTLDTMTFTWKVSCLLFVGIPRLLVCCLFAKVGAGFIVRSPERDIIIDTVSMLFVVDISTFMYNAFTTNSVKRQIERIEPLKWFPSNAHRLAAFLFVNFAYPLLLILFSIAVVWHSRQPCGASENFASSLKVGAWDASQDAARNIMEIVD